MNCAYDLRMGQRSGLKVAGDKNERWKVFCNILAIKLAHTEQP